MSNATKDQIKLGVVRVRWILQSGLFGVSSGSLFSGVERAEAGVLRVEEKVRGNGERQYRPLCQGL